MKVTNFEVRTRAKSKTTLFHLFPGCTGSTSPGPGGSEPPDDVYVPVEDDDDSDGEAEPELPLTVALWRVPLSVGVK